MAAELKASVELDALVAEKVMGARWCNVMGMRMLEDGSDDQASWYSGAKGDEPIWPHGHSVHPYSSDIKAAWRVVEKMRELHGFGFCLGVNGMASPKNDQVGACFYEGFIGAGRLTYSPIASDDEGCGATSGTAAHAICLAALDALVQLPLHKGTEFSVLPHDSEAK